VATTFERAKAHPHWGTRIDELAVLERVWVAVNKNATPLQPAMLTVFQGGKPDKDAERRAKEKAYGDAKVAAAIAEMDARDAAMEAAKNA
jgi:hypothetical protein